MNESFDKHFTSNADYWHTLARKGFVNTDDIVKARNYYDKYSYAEQNEAVKRLNEALSEVLKRNPDNQGLKNFISSMTEASDEMIKDKVTSSFRDLDNVTDTDITLKAKKLGIPVEEFRNQFKLVKERIDTEKGRERRKKELDEMAWYNPAKWATSDYEKQRYINDPDASIIGKEGNGKWFNKGEAISDLAFGIAGAAGDMLPGLGSLIGTGVRGLRDIHHKATLSKYQKNLEDILWDVGEDAAFNVFFEKTPFASKLKEVDENVQNAGKLDGFLNNVNEYRNIKNEVRANKAGTDMLNWNHLYKMSDLQIEKAIDGMPDSPLKQKLKGYVAGGVEKNRDKIGETLVTYESLSNPKRMTQQHSYYDEAGNVKPFKKDYWKGQGVDDYVKRQAKASVQSKPVKIVSNLLDLKNKGKNLLKELKTAEGRDSMPNTSDREDIEWFKENYARDWEAGFVPRGKDDEPIMKAYREWKEENKKPSVRSVMGGM